MNDAACDLWCQQFGDEDYAAACACLFPRVYCQSRWEEYLDAFGHDVDGKPATADEILIASDWFDESGETEFAEFMRLAVQWDFQPPSAELRELAMAIRGTRSRHWRYTVRQHETALFQAINAVFDGLE